MPYFLKKHILFIHIPKTGGTSVEGTLMNNDNMTLRTRQGNNLLPEPFNSISLQHQFYSTIYKYRDLCKIDFDNKLQIISIVRNPYDRIISDMLWFPMLNSTSTPQETTACIKEYLNYKGYQCDNHNVPQYLYLCDNSGNLYPNITILKTETLDSDFKNLNMDFEIKRRYQVGAFKGNQENKQEKQAVMQSKYKKFLNKESIELINNYYKKDFELFGYDMISDP